MADLDRVEPGYVEGVPQHDFTAGGAHGGYASDMYNSDPFAHAGSYDYDTSYYHQEAPAHQVYGSDYSTQDLPAEGYADLHRGNSGSSHGSGTHNLGYGNGYPEDSRVQPSDFPTPGQYIGRPTQGGDGP